MVAFLLLETSIWLINPTDFVQTLNIPPLKAKQKFALNKRGCFQGLGLGDDVKVYLQYCLNLCCVTLMMILPVLLLSLYDWVEYYPESPVEILEWCVRV